MNKPEAVRRARKLRREQTDAERILWARLWNMQVNGEKFRRQQPLGPYTVDFVNMSRRLVIEIDGGQHNEPRADTQRTAWLESEGFQVIRFWNNEVLSNLDGVLARVSEALTTAHTSPSPDLSPRGRGKYFVSSPLVGED